MKITQSAHFVQLEHFGLYTEDFAKGLHVLFCFGALRLPAFPAALAQGSPSRNHLTRLALSYQPLPSHPGADLLLNRKLSPLPPPPETQEERTMQKNTDFKCIGFVSTVTEGERRVALG